jgi:hypothetical protein
MEASSNVVYRVSGRSIVVELPVVDSFMSTQISFGLLMVGNPNDKTY